MDSQKSNKATIGVLSLVMMIFTTIYGFNNGTIAYLQMGYASIIWYVFAAIFFFLPSGLMFAEYGSTFNNAEGGIYSWLEGSVGPKFAFYGTFIWLTSWELWLVSTASRVWIPISVLFQGSDQTQTWNFAGLASTQVIGLLGVLFIIVVTLLAGYGMKWISKISSFGGIIMVILNGLFFIVSLLILVLNHFKLQQPITSVQTFIHSPNASFATTMGMLSFVVYAIFAYGGLESLGGVTDSLKNPKKTFPQGILIATIAISLLYAISILFWGISANWQHVLNNSKVNLGNVGYVLMDNLGYTLGQSLHLSTSVSLTIGQWFARFVGFDNFIMYLGSYFVLIYSPLKSFILGTPRDFWPTKLTQLNRQHMPAYAMWIQAIVVAVIIVGVSFGGSSAKQFYNILTLMGNVSTSVPYLYLIAAFPFFKAKQNLERPYVFYKTQTSANIASIIGFMVVALAILFTFIEPILQHQYFDAFWTVAGPIFFTIVAYFLYRRYEQRKIKD
ncbi:MAG: glutamate/gamma-aminobutyrate family transporter YjeM [Lactobacillus sp.]|nr:glutamate/gamma-aminobutyrate family transporter YjeM [Lactobacillus sp.]